MNRVNRIYRLTAILIIMLFLCCFLGCQPTPEQPVVQDKSDIMEKIQATAIPTIAASNTSSITPTPTEEVVISNHWKINEQWLDGKIQLNINNDLPVVDGDMFAVVKLLPIEFTQEQVNKIIKVFFGNRTVYEPRHMVITKSQIEEVIILTKKQMKDLSSDMAQSNGCKTLDELKKIGEKELEVLYKQLKNTPESYKPKVADTDITTPIITPYSSDPTKVIDVVSASGSGGDSRLEIYNDLKHGSSICFDNTGEPGEDFAYILRLDKNMPITLSTPIEEAEKMAEEIVAKLPTSDMKMVTSECRRHFRNGKQGYVIRYCRYLNDIPVWPIHHNDRTDKTYNYWLSNEIIDVFIDDTGLLGVKWSCPMKSVGVVNDNANIIKLDDIKEQVVNSFFHKFSYYEDREIEYVQFNSTKISLSYARAKVPNNNGEYMLIPVYNIYCEATTKYGSKDEESRIEDIKDNLEMGFNDRILGENNTIIHRGDYPTVYLTINAIDGSVFNRREQY